MCLGRNRSQQTCYNRFAGVTVLPVLAAVLTGRSEIAAIESFSGISVRIATARSTIRLARSLATRRSHSVDVVLHLCVSLVSSGVTVRNRGHAQNDASAHRALRQRARCAFSRSRWPCRNRRSRLSAGKEGRELDPGVALACLSRGSVSIGDNPPVLILVDQSP